MTVGALVSRETGNVVRKRELCALGLRCGAEDVVAVFAAAPHAAFRS